MSSSCNSVSGTFMAATATNSSSPLVKIDGTGLRLMNTADIPLEGPIRVVSILGKARMGKSTFLNAILSHIGGHTMNPFMTQDNDEHCTRGIDYYFCEKERLLLLDCQGLSLEDSSHDPQLLLFAYLVSDVLILNERMMLQNEALKLMEPICGFMIYVDMETIKKPKLCFRISDADIVKDPKKNLDRVMARYSDQYQSIRDSITNLFQPDIGIVKTNTMLPSLRSSLEDNDYMSFLDNELIGFRLAIDAIITTLPPGRDAREWCGSLPQIIHGINHNEKISIDMLDIVSKMAKLELIEYKMSIPADVFADIPVTALQESYDRLIVPRIHAQNELLTDFQRKFKSVSKEIKDPYFQELTERLGHPIETAKIMMEQHAEQQVSHLVALATQDRSYPSLHNLLVSFTSRPSAYWDSYLIGFQELATAIQPLYDPVRIKYETWMKAIKQRLLDALNTCIAIETANLIRAAKYVSEALQQFQIQCLQTISNMVSVINSEGKGESVLTQDPPLVVQKFITAATAPVMKDLGFIPTPISIRLTMVNKTLIIEKDYAAETRDIVIDSIMTLNHSFPITHDLLAQVYVPWTEGIESQKVRFATAVTDRKKQLLLSSRFDEITSAQRIKDVDFVSVQSFGYMTVETFDRCYKPLVRKTIQQMEEKGLLIEGDTDDFVRINISDPIRGQIDLPLKFVLRQCLEITRSGNMVGFYNIGTHPEPAIAHLFKNIHSEVLAFERAKPKEESLFVFRRDSV